MSNDIYLYTRGIILGYTLYFYWDIYFLLITRSNRILFDIILYYIVE